MIPGGRQAGPRTNGTHGGRSVYDPNPEDDPFYQKLTSGESASTNYFKSTRQSKLLSENEQNRTLGVLTLLIIYVVEVMKLSNVLCLVLILLLL